MADTAQLKAGLQAIRDSIDNNHAVRLHRAISWLRCADECADNRDLQFISLWIAFNSCYCADDHGEQSLAEREVFQIFVRKLVRHDAEKEIYHCLWQQFPGPVRALIKNPFLFHPFWRVHSEGGDESAWRGRFTRSSDAANRFLARQQVPQLLGVILDRLYVLRNQLVHGGATYQSNVNRTQVGDGCNMLSALMPIIVAIMLAHPAENWGQIRFPVIDSQVP